MLEIRNVSKDLGQFKLNNVSLEIEDGEYFVIIGPTGAGKTILLETLVGVHSPDSGEVYFNGVDITSLPPKDRSITMVYQDYMLFPHLTIEENIAFGLKYKNLTKDEIAKKVLDMATILGIDHLLKRKPDTLSGGEQQRTAISRALILEPSVLLLDEPLSALDAFTRERLRRELKKLHALFNTTIIHITHNFNEVFSLADRVMVMDGGESMQVGTPHDILRRPKSEFIAGFVGSENILQGTCQTDEKGKVVFISDGLTIHSANEPAATCTIATIRPEEIIVARPEDTIPYENRIVGTVDEIIDNGLSVKMYVHSDRLFSLIVNRTSFHNLNIEIGSQVQIGFPAEAVHIF